MALAGCIGCAALSFAGVDFRFPATGDMPKYFSGANNRASAKATVNGTTLGITRWELWLNDQKTAEADVPPGPLGLYLHEVAPAIMFTSTKFPPGTNISIVLKVWTTDGPDPVEAWSAPVPKKDIAAIFGRSEWEDPPTAPTAGAHATKPHVQSANYDVSRFFVSPGWNVANVQEALGECSLFYASTHGDVEKFQTDLDEQFVWAMEQYGNPNVLSLRTAAIGTGLPPFNSTERPPITIAFMESCETGATDSFSSAFLFPSRNAYSPMKVENQAYIGYTIKVGVDIAREVSDTFWRAMERGSTVLGARWSVFMHLIDAGLSDLNPDDLTHDMLNLIMPIYGDTFTRLHSVYTGNSDPQLASQWWRLIQ
ncbi:MAG: hypothetical protein BroJett009_04320 [Armatimonadota bacterium]|nr:MAG: hypothetical protein BroJett009_04320 [Armatimonadota bacterium]